MSACDIVRYKVLRGKKLPNINDVRVCSPFVTPCDHLNAALGMKKHYFVNPTTGRRVKRTGPTAKRISAGCRPTTRQCDIVKDAEHGNWRYITNMASGRSVKMRGDVGKRIRDRCHASARGVHAAAAVHIPAPKPYVLKLNIKKPAAVVAPLAAVADSAAVGHAADSPLAVLADAAAAVVRAHTPAQSQHALEAVAAAAAEFAHASASHAPGMIALSKSADKVATVMQSAHASAAQRSKSLTDLGKAVSVAAIEVAHCEPHHGGKVAYYGGAKTSGPQRPARTKKCLRKCAPEGAYCPKLKFKPLPYMDLVLPAMEENDPFPDVPIRGPWVDPAHNGDDDPDIYVNDPDWCANARSDWLDTHDDWIKDVIEFTNSKSHEELKRIQRQADEYIESLSEKE